MTYCKRWWNKNETIHSYSDSSTGLLENFCFPNNFSESVLSLHYQFPFLYSGLFPGKRNLTGAQPAGELHSDISQNRIHYIHAASFLNVLHYSMKRPCACAYFNFEMGFNRQDHWINSQYSAAPQCNSSCLGINHIGGTATGNVKLGQHFY